jgi:23S rRNA G2445 N2-methylase RlmL
MMFLVNKMNDFKFFSISNPFMGECSQNEIISFLRNKKGVELKRDAIIFDTNFENVTNIFKQNQSLLCLTSHLLTFDDIEKFSLKDVDFTNFLSKNAGEKLSFSIEIRGVKGQENRISLAKPMYQLIRDIIKKQLGIDAEVDHKNPQILFQVYSDLQNYHFGLRLNKEDFDSRKYRVFPHQATFKADFAYQLLQECEIKSGLQEKILFAFSKDGVLPIECAILLNKLEIRKVRKKDYVSLLLPSIVATGQDKPVSKKVEDKLIEVFAFDQTEGTTRACRNNSKLAGTSKLVNLNKCSLEDLDIKYEKEMFDKVIFHVTRKDEVNLNEMYNQLNFVLKIKGKAFFISRPDFSVVLPSTYKEIFIKKFQRGNSYYHLTCIEKLE